MLKNSGENNILLKGFIKKNLIKYLIPNVIFNSVIPYLTLRNLSAVHLFQGQYCFARFLLPMALFLPFVITFDILKKCVAHVDSTERELVVPDNLKKAKFFFKMASVNGFGTLFITALAMLIIQLSLPENYSYNGSVLSVFLGILAGIMSVIFTLLPIRLWLKYISTAY